MASGTQYEIATKKRMSISALLIFIIVPILIALGVMVGQKGYLVISILILFTIMTPFFMIFEKRKPKAREIVLIAMMSAIVVTAHLVFHLVLPVHIGTALVIISGIALGPEAGFLIGALSRFICNFYMGQGPWTPWQMFCWGLLGFLAGLAFNRGNLEKLNARTFKIIMGPTLSVVFFELIAYISILLFPASGDGPDYWRLYLFGAFGIIIGVLLQKSRLPISNVTMSVFTLFITFIIYGGIMNIAALVTSMGITGSETYGTGFSLEALKAIYITGLPYDLLHGVTASICVFLFGEPMIMKLERIKIKYGIYK